MTPFSNRIDDDFTARFYRGEAMVIELQLEDANGAAEDLAGRTFFVAIYHAGGEVFDSRAAIVATDAGSDRPHLSCTFVGDITDALYGEDMLRYSVGEFLANGNDIIVDGALKILPAPPGGPITTSVPIGDVATRFVRRLSTQSRSRIAVSERGPRGLSLAESLGTTPEAIFNEQVLAPVAAALADFEQVQVLASILIPSGATAILADSGNAIQIGDMM